MPWVRIEEASFDSGLLSRRSFRHLRTDGNSVTLFDEVHNYACGYATLLFRGDVSLTRETDNCTQLLRFHGDTIPKENKIYYQADLDQVSRVTETADRVGEVSNAAMQVAFAQDINRQYKVEIGIYSRAFYPTVTLPAGYSIKA